jgi:hypothetical protein
MDVNAIRKNINLAIKVPLSDCQNIGSSLPQRWQTRMSTGFSVIQAGDTCPEIRIKCASKASYA